VQKRRVNLEPLENKTLVFSCASYNGIT
jgi:hypothetical protein